MKCSGLFRPVLITGLSVFISFCTRVSAQSVPLYRLSSEPFSFNPVKVADIDSISFLNVSYQFDPVITEKSRNEADDFNSSIHAHVFDALYFYRNPGYSFFMNFAYTDMFAAYRNQVDPYAVTFDRKEADFSSGFALEQNRYSLGLGIGFHAPDHFHNDQIRNSSFENERIFSLKPWQFSLGYKMKITPWLIWNLDLFSGPVHSSLTRVLNNKSGGFRYFPLTIHRYSAETGIELNSKKGKLKSALYYIKTDNSEMIESRNSMPSELKLATYGGLISGSVRGKISDSLFLMLTGNFSGGYVSVFNFEKKKYTVLETGSLRMQTASYSAGLRLPHTINTGISGAYFMAQAPSGYLRLSTFSNWSLFKPLDYRFEHGEFKFLETGLFINKSFSFRFMRIDPEITISYIKTGMVYDYSEKKVIVLLPVYSDPLHDKLLDTRFLLITPSMTIKTNVGSIGRIDLSAVQRIPLIQKSTSRSSQKSGEGGSTGSNPTFSGGTTVKISFRLFI